MMNGLRWIPGWAFGIAALAAIAALSQVPYADPRADVATVRLSWRARGTLVQDCRRLSDEELARLPEHMRREEVCEGRVSPFRLELRIDGEAIVVDTIHGSGVREDRPLYVFREVPVDPGPHTILVRFERLGAAGPSRPGVQSFPALLEHTFNVTTRAGRVALITYDDASSSLVLRSSED